MKKFLYILISGILGLVLASCGGIYVYEYKVENLQTARLNITYNNTSGTSYALCFKLNTALESGSHAMKSKIEGFTYREGGFNRGFCKDVTQSRDNLVLIPKSFKYVYYENDKATKTIDHTSGEITYTVHEGYTDVIYQTFKVSADTTTVNLTL